LTRLGAGEYLLSLDIALKKQHVQRQVRFQVQ
jgi:hypothetical protein